MIVPEMAISNLVSTQQIYSEKTNGAHAHNRDRVPLRPNMNQTIFSNQYMFISGCISIVYRLYCCSSARSEILHFCNTKIAILTQEQLM